MKITEIENHIERNDAVIIASEQWAKAYKKNPEALRKLIKLEARLARLVRGYFRTFAQERLDTYINWQLYTQANVQAANFQVMVDFDEIDDAENDLLFKIIYEPLQASLALGATTAETQYKIDLGLNTMHEAVMKATDKYVGKLVTGVTNTTKDRIKSSISQSIKLGEDTKTASKRLEAIIGDPRRAELIARTESVRSYSSGIKLFGEQSGATRIYWELSSDPCDSCISAYEDMGGADGKAFDEAGDPPPDHPNCRCGTSLSHSYD